MAQPRILLLAIFASIVVEAIDDSLLISHCIRFAMESEQKTKVSLIVPWAKSQVDASLGIVEKALGRFDSRLLRLDVIGRKSRTELAGDLSIPDSLLVLIIDGQQVEVEQLLNLGDVLDDFGLVDQQKSLIVIDTSDGLSNDQPRVFEFVDRYARLFVYLGAKPVEKDVELRSDLDDVFDLRRPYPPYNETAFFEDQYFRDLPY